MQTTTAVETYLEAAGDEGAWSWNAPQDGITVSSDVRAGLELLHELLGGGTFTVTRDQQTNRVTGITTTAGNQQIVANLNEKMEDAIDSFDDLEESDGYCP